MGVAMGTFRFLISAAVVGACFSAVAQPGVAMNDVGNVKAASGGTVTLMTMRLSNKPIGGMYVSDKYQIKTNLVALERAQLVRLRELIDATIVELDKSDEQPKP